MSERRRVLIPAALSVVAALAYLCFALARSLPPFTPAGEPGAHNSALAASVVAEVPTTLTGGAVSVNDQVVLAPLAHPPKEAMTSADAIRASSAFAKAQASPPAVLEASVSVPNSSITDVPAWVITFKTSKPMDLAVGGPTSETTARSARRSAGAPLVTHFSVVLNATTGKFVVGFFTK